MKTKLIRLNLIILLTVLLQPFAAQAATNIPPVLRWSLEEGAGSFTREEVSGVTNVAELLNGPTWTNGIAPGSSNAVNFQITTPGSYIDAGTLQTNGAYVSAGSATNNVIIMSQWTVTAWVKIPADASYLYPDRCIVTTDTDGPSWWLFFVRSWGGVPNSLGFDFINVRQDSLIDIPTDKPVFVAISGDASGTHFSPGNKHRFAVWDGSTWTYAEGDLYSSLRLDGLEIGSFNNGDRQFWGDIDEVRIYDTVLSPAELTGLALGNEIGGDLGATVSAASALTSDTNLDFIVQFSEDVQGFDTNDLDIATTGTVTVPSAPVITGSNNTYTVSVPISGDGTITVDLHPGSGVQTLSGHPLVLHAVSQVVTVDQTPPTATVTLIGDNPTAALEINFAVLFSEPVTGFETNDLLVTHLGTTNAEVSISGGDDSYIVTLTGVTGDGSFTLSIVPGGGVHDQAGNVLAGTFASDPVNHFIDLDAPYVVSITPDSTGPITNSVVSFTVVFSEPVLGFDYASLIFVTTNLAFVETDDPQSTNGITYSFYAYCAVADGATNGSFTASVSLAAGITDLAGNPLTTPNPASAEVVVAPSPYQLWAINQGLTAGVNFSPFDDPDNDGRINAKEFMRDGLPLVPDPPKRRMHIANVGGQAYGALTMAAPDWVVYQHDGTNIMYAGIAFIGADSVLSASDLTNFFSEDTGLTEDPAIPVPPDMPALSPGWSYRHFRFTSPITELPIGFFWVEFDY